MNSWLDLFADRAQGCAWCVTATYYRAYLSFCFVRLTNSFYFLFCNVLLILITKNTKFIFDSKYLNFDNDTFWKIIA